MSEHAPRTPTSQYGRAAVGEALQLSVERITTTGGRTNETNMDGEREKEKEKVSEADSIYAVEDGETKLDTECIKPSTHAHTHIHQLFPILGSMD